MSQSVSAYLLERLQAWGVDRVFAYPGDGINGILGAWVEADSAPQFVQARHEEMAAFEAVGYAKFSGKVGVCMATSGPGAIHLLNGLYDAKLDHVPVVAIVGQTDRTAQGGSYQQEVDLASLFKDVCHQYVQTLNAPQQLPNLVDRAMRTALATHSPTCIIVPYDVQELEWEAPGHEFKMVPSSLGIVWPHVTPDDDGVRQAAEILNAGSKVAILVGQGARGARAEITEVADVLGAGVAKALLREVRDNCAADIAAGEYGYTVEYYAPMIAAGAVDCLQADVTRCGGCTAWAAVAHLAAANGLQISGHCAPNLRAHIAIGAPNLRHLEYFHDHTRIEDPLFDGTLLPTDGALIPDRTRPGHGLALRREPAEPYRVA